MSKDFVHLHVHTEFSLLDGLSRIDKLVDRAVEQEMSALAITDHGVMFGVIDFYRACKKANIKPIIGVEAYLATRKMTDRDPRLDKRAYHMLLLAKNMTGYQNLLKIASASQLEGYYYRPRIDREFLAAHAEGLIATSGCLAAEIPRMVMDGRDDEAQELVGWYHDVFGEDHFYLELQQHDIPELDTLNRWLVDYRQKGHTPVQLLATNDVHYVRKQDADTQDTLLCIQTGTLKTEVNRMKMSDPSYHLTSKDEMWTLFNDVPEALTNSIKIAEMCDLDMDTEAYHLPVFPVPEKFTVHTYLRHLCEMGMEWRYEDWKNDPVLQKRLDYELGIIHNMGFDTYFLIVWDLCEFARHVDIWWNVRGSGAGSLVAYSLGITNIDPIHNSLLFERFLNPGRVSMPDIDLDYPDDRRGEMIAYTARKYGEDKVAAIITFGTLGAKAAVRDVGRALDVDLAKVNRAAGLIPQEAKQKPLMEYVETNPELKRFYEDDAEIRSIIDTAKELQGVSRHASTHAAGVIVADKPLLDYIPLHRITGKDPSGGALQAVTQFPMETAESIGLLKVDFLGLSTLTILRKACDLIEQHQGIKYTMDNIPYRHDDDRVTDEQRKMLDEAFEMMGRGETIGVFQVESGGMQQMLRGMRPQRFENIVAGISLYRPGPMEFIPQYNRRLHNEEEPTYRHELLEPILKETYGIFVYQEQIMQVAGELFGYELGEADLMRKAVSKKREKDLMKHKDIFLDRGPQNGIDVDSAEKIFADIEFFANYGFNKAHASDYAVITVQTAFLKTHYPEEYMTALLCVQRDDSTKVATFLEECRRLDIPVLPPDANHSMLDFDIEVLADGKRGIRFGLAAVKNAGAASLEHIIVQRQEGGKFTSLNDFCQRVDIRAVGKRTLESLIKVGALEDFGTRSTLVAAMERIIGYSTRHHRDKEIGQMNMFGGEGSSEEDDLLQNLGDIEDVGQREILGWERELLGLYVTGRPVDPHKHFFRNQNLQLIQELKDPNSPSKEEVRVGGEVMSIRKIVTRNNENMAVLQLEDWHDSAGSIEVVLFPRTWRQVVSQFSEKDREFDAGEIVVISGKYDTSRGEPQIIANELTTDLNMVTADGDMPEFDPATPGWADTEQPPPPEYDEETGEVVSSSPASTNSVDVSPIDTGVNEAIHEEENPPWVDDDAERLQLPTEEADYNNDSERWLMVTFPRSKDPDKDRRRLRRIHNKLISYPGKDRFTIVIAGSKNSVELDFPNHTTRHCPELIEELVQEVGIDNVMVLAPEF